VQGRGVGVDPNLDHEPPADWTEVFATADLATELPPGQLRRVEADGFPVVVLRDGESVAALPATCPHRGAPLDEGTLVRERGSECLECPWHGSRFRTDDGALARGPAAMPLPPLDVCARPEPGRIVVEVRRPPSEPG